MVRVKHLTMTEVQTHCISSDGNSPQNTVSSGLRRIAP